VELLLTACAALRYTLFVMSAAPCACVLWCILLRPTYSHALRFFFLFRSTQRYDSALHSSVFGVAGFRPPLHGSTSVALSGASPELATLALARHLIWLRGQVVQAPRDAEAVGAWCYQVCVVG